MLARELENIYSGDDTHYQDAGLESGSPYNYRVAAENDTGEGEYSELHDIWTLPSEPDSFDVAEVTTTEITAHWSSAVRGEEGYVFLVNGEETEQLPTGSTEYTITSLTAGTTYKLGIKAVNRSGSGAVKILSVTTLPEAPVVVEDPRGGSSPLDRITLSMIGF